MLRPTGLVCVLCMVSGCTLLYPLEDYTGGEPAPEGAAGDAATDADGGASDAALDGRDAAPDPDAADADDAADASACPGAAACERYVFVTSATFNGATGGIVGGDVLCKNAANASSLAFLRGRAWFSWMSSGNGSPSSRMVQGTKPYRTIDGTPIAADWTGLVSGQLTAPIAIDENGNGAAGGVWTGTTSAGTLLMNATCTGWSAGGAGANGRQGKVGTTDGRWTDDLLLPCSVTAHVYCFER